MIQIFTQNSEVIFRLLLAVVLGMLIGAERLLVHKEAGMKTHALVSMGSALFIIISEYLAIKYQGFGGFNPAIIAANIIVGIGFLGAGSIIHQGDKPMGLTTAAGFWVTAAIGMSAGFGMFSLAIIATILVLIIFIVMNLIEKPIKKISDRALAKNQKE